MSLPDGMPKEATNYLAAIFAAMQENCNCKACGILRGSAAELINKASSGLKQNKPKR